MLKKINLILGATILSVGTLFLFFGGTWDGVRFGLEILGGVWILQTSYNILKKDHEEKLNSEELKKETEKYFKD